jgi:hypothetical protein
MTRSDSSTILSDIQEIQPSSNHSSQSGSIRSNDDNVIIDLQQQQGQTSALNTDQQLVDQGQLAEENNVNNNAFSQPNSSSREPSRNMALLASIATSFLGIAGVVASSNAGLIAGAVASGFVAVAGAGAVAVVLRNRPSEIKSSGDFSSRDPNRSQENTVQQQRSAVIDINSLTAPQPVEVASDQNQVSDSRQNQPQRTQSAPSSLGIAVENVVQLDQQLQRSQSF